MTLKDFYKMKKEFFALKQGQSELQRAINSKDIFWIRRLIRKKYGHLQAIYQLCYDKKEKGPG